MKNKLVPVQHEGSKLDVTAHIAFDSPADAEPFFTKVKQRLLNVNGWDEVCGYASSAFRLVDAENQEIHSPAKEGDYIQIDIPGPGTLLGEGYDWVRVERIVEQADGNSDILSMTVRPCSHPSKPDESTAHFFQAAATSTFQVKRMGNTIYAEVHGRNELPNNENVGLVDKIRNTVVATGAKLGFSFPQWKLLAEGLIKN